MLDLLTMSISRVRTKRAATCPDHASAAARARGSRSHGAPSHDGTQLHDSTQPQDTTPIEIDFTTLLDDAPRRRLLHCRHSRALGNSGDPDTHGPRASHPDGAATAWNAGVRARGKDAVGLRERPQKPGGNAGAARARSEGRLFAARRRHEAESRRHGLGTAREITKLRSGLVFWREG